MLSLLAGRDLPEQLRHHRMRLHEVWVALERVAVTTAESIDRFRWRQENPQRGHLLDDGSTGRDLFRFGKLVQRSHRARELTQPGEPGMPEQELEKRSVRSDRAMNLLVRYPFAVQQRLVQKKQRP